MDQQTRRYLLFMLAGVISIAVIIGFYFGFRRTLIADVREAMLVSENTDTYAHGEILFGTRGCTGCHTLEKANATGDEGPNLNDVMMQHEETYIRESIVNPRAVLASNCPDGDCQPIMPDYGAILDDEQVDALVVYLTQTR
jgi:mono/diheme cytochrome c family protein